MERGREKRPENFVSGGRPNTAAATKGGKKDNFFDDSHDDDFSSYFQNKKKSSNPFGEDEEDFSTSPSGGNHHGFWSDPHTATSSRLLEEKPLTAKDLYQQEVQAIQERTLNTTERSMRLIDESEAVGVAAAQVRTSAHLPTTVPSID